MTATAIDRARSGSACRRPMRAMIVRESCSISTGCLAAIARKASTSNRASVVSRTGRDRRRAWRAFDQADLTDHFSTWDLPDQLSAPGGCQPAGDHQIAGIGGVAFGEEHVACGEQHALTRLDDLRRQVWLDEQQLRHRARPLADDRSASGRVRRPAGGRSDRRRATAGERRRRVGRPRIVRRRAPLPFEGSRPERRSHRSWTQARRCRCRDLLSPRRISNEPSTTRNTSLSRAPSSTSTSPASTTRSTASDHGVGVAGRSVTSTLPPPSESFAGPRLGPAMRTVARPNLRNPKAATIREVEALGPGGGEPPNGPLLSTGSGGLWQLSEDERARAAMEAALRPYVPDLLRSWPRDCAWQALEGTMVSADISGFTSLAERLGSARPGGRRGAQCADQQLLRRNDRALRSAWR